MYLAHAVRCAVGQAGLALALLIRVVAAALGQHLSRQLDRLSQLLNFHLFLPFLFIFSLDLRPRGHQMEVLLRRFERHHAPT